MSAPFFETQGLTIRFGGLTAVDHLSFAIQPGEILSLIGPNGAGKTTAFNGITGFLPLSEGSVNFCGKNLMGLPPFQIANQGLIRTFQQTSVFPDVPVEECIVMGAHKIAPTGLWNVLLRSSRYEKKEGEIQRRAKEILAFTCLGGKAGVLAKNLSYGEQRLLEIAVALAAGPKLLLLDEPVSGMNPEESHTTMKLILALREQGTTILLVEHDMNVVMDISDRIVVLNYGKKIAEGSPREVRENQDVIEAYLGGSFECSFSPKS
jgi:branched-chain amino acid transport system ATP-binding protein